MISLPVNNKLLFPLIQFFSKLGNNKKIPTGSTAGVIEPANKPLHILMADDDPDDIEIFQEAIAEIAPHYKISAVTDGNEVLSFLKKQHPDIVFLDLNMPCKNGIECLEEIRSVRALKDLPVIIYSTTVNKAQVDLSFNKGASLYLQKPSHYDGIKKSIRSILSGGLNALSAQRDKSAFLLKV